MNIYQDVLLIWQQAQEPKLAPLAQNALIKAVQSGNLKHIAKICRGADFAALDDQGLTALDHALLRRDFNATLLLMEQGAHQTQLPNGLALFDELTECAPRGRLRRGLVCANPQVLKRLKDYMPCGLPLLPDDDATAQELMKYLMAQGELDLIVLLLAEGPNLKFTDYLGDSLLHHVVRLTQGNLIQVLFDAGHRLDVVNDDGECPLDLAIKYHRLRAACALIRLGANVDSHGRQGQALWLMGVIAGHAELCRLLLDRGVDAYRPYPVHLTLFYPLQHIIECEHNEILKLLMARPNFNVNQSMARGLTPLLCAARVEHPLLAELLRLGADTSALDEHQNTALDISINKMAWQLCSKLLTAGSPLQMNSDQAQKLWFSLVYAGPLSLSLCQLLVQRGININLCDNQSMTLLDHAIENNKRELFDYLMGLPVHLQAENGSQDSLIGWALRHGRTDMAISLYKKGALIAWQDFYGLLSGFIGAGELDCYLKLISHPNFRALRLDEAARNQGQRPLLSVALRAQAYAFVHPLLELSRSNVNEYDTYGNSPLVHLICNADHGPQPLEMFELLLSRGANIDAVNNKGATLLMIAARYDHPVCTRLLARVNINRVDHRGSSALHYLIHHLNHTHKLEEFLAHKQLDPNIANQAGHTALSLAALRLNKPRINALRLLLEAGANLGNMCLINFWARPGVKLAHLLSEYALANERYANAYPNLLNDDETPVLAPDYQAAHAQLLRLNLQKMRLFEAFENYLRARTLAPSRYPNIQVLYLYWQNLLTSEPPKLAYKLRFARLESLNKQTTIPEYQQPAGAMLNHLQLIYRGRLYDRCDSKLVDSFDRLAGLGIQQAIKTPP